MALVAPLSRYKRNTFLIWIVLCAGFGAYCVYDGYYNEEFKKKHTIDGEPDSTLVFNRKAPPFLFGAAVLLGAYLVVIHGRKVVAEEDALVINGRKKIAYDAIQKIDKTDFESKGRFTLTYHTPDGKETNLELNDRNYDNLGAILAHLVAKIS